MLAPREAATDEECESELSPSESESSRSDAEEETSALPKDSAQSTLHGHALALGDSPLVSEDDSVGAEQSRLSKEPSLEEAPEERKSPDQSKKVEVKNRGPQPYDVPMTGDFYMHDDRTSGSTPKATFVPRRQWKSRRSEGIDAQKWKHDKFEELEREFERFGSGGRGYRGRRGGYDRGRWTKSTSFSPPNTTTTISQTDGPPLSSRASQGDAQKLGASLQELSINNPIDRGRGRGRPSSRGYQGRSRGRGYSGRFGHNPPYQYHS